MLKHGKKSRLLSAILALALVTAILPLSAKAAEDYVGALFDAAATIDVGTVAAELTGVYTYTPGSAGGNIITITAAGEYILTGTSADNIVKVTVDGVSLLLDGVEIDTSTTDDGVGITNYFNGYGICVYGNGTLGDVTTDVYLKPGAANASTLRTSAAYGASVLLANGGSVVIHGGAVGTDESEYGKLTASTGGNGAGIGGGYSSGAGGSITITGGDITASASSSGAGIGGGTNYPSVGGSITITGGAKVTANGGNGARGAGIGGGSTNSRVGNITIDGGATVTANAGLSGAGIGGGIESSGVTGDITIDGGAMVTATGGINGGAGIGAGYNFSGVGNITITDSTLVTVTGAVGGSGGAGIGAGGSDSLMIGDITITNSTFTTVVGGGSGGAGIGGGVQGSLLQGNITITGSVFGTVSGSGTNGGAGIGGGNGGSPVDGTITITRSTFGAITGGGQNSAAIGNGGLGCNANIVKINADTVIGTITPDDADAVKVKSGGEIWIIGEVGNTETYPAGVNLMEKALLLAPELDEGNAANPFAEQNNFEIVWDGVDAADTLTTSPTTFTATVKSKAVVTGTSRVLPTLAEVLGVADKDTFEEYVYTFEFSIPTPPPYYPPSVKNPAESEEPEEPSEPETPPAFPFEDVDDDDWFNDDVRYAYENGLMLGTSETLFSPGIGTTRGMIATVVYRMAGEPGAAELEQPFGDVADGMWYTDAIKWGAKNGILLGYDDGNFRPDKPITRQELAAILYRYMEFAEINIPVNEQYVFFADEADIADYAKNAVQTLNKLGIIKGISVDTIKIDPKRTATRAEVAAILHRFTEATK